MPHDARWQKLSKEEMDAEQRALVASVRTAMLVVGFQVLKDTDTPVILDGTQVARLLEQLCAAGIAELNYAINGERTVVKPGGEVEFTKPEDN